MPLEVLWKHESVPDDARLWFIPSTPLDRQLWATEGRSLPAGKRHVVPHTIFYVCRSIYGYTVRRRGFEEIYARGFEASEAGYRLACATAIRAATNVGGVAETYGLDPRDAAPAVPPSAIDAHLEGAYEALTELPDE